VVLPACPTLCATLCYLRVPRFGYLRVPRFGYLRVPRFGGHTIAAGGLTMYKFGENNNLPEVAAQGQQMLAAGLTMMGGSLADDVALGGGALGGRAAVAELDPSMIRFSQSSVSDVNEIVASMSKKGWVGEPIDVVKMADGLVTSFDNTRVLAAARAGINVEARIWDASSSFPAGRWAAKDGTIPNTWGEAINMRIQQQNRGFRTKYPNGSFVTGSKE